MSYPTKLGTYNYKGCWKDDSRRALPLQINNGNWTLQQCRDGAVARNKDTFGLQYYGQCFVGDSKTDNYKKYGPIQNCPSNGGAWNQQVYSINDPAPYLTSTDLKCYQQRYPDLRGMNNEQLLDHWINIGSKESRSYNCPAPQSISGTYEFQGCYNDSATSKSIIAPWGETTVYTPSSVVLYDGKYWMWLGNDNGNSGSPPPFDDVRWGPVIFPRKNRSIPNKRNNVNNIAECQKQAEENRDTVFGIQNGTECWTGKDIGLAMKSVNYNKNECGNMGGSGTNQVYLKTTPFPAPITNESCEYKMSPIELQCYKNTYPELMDYNENDLQKHWSKIGCKENRNNQCPSPQTSSGLYNFKGCFNDSAKETGIRSIPNQLNNVMNVDSCKKQAEAKGNNVFGLQGYGECWTGNDVSTAMKSPNYNKDKCGNMGKGWTNQVYVRSILFPPPLLPVPTLKNPNFSPYIDTTTQNPNTFENFDNKSSKPNKLANNKVLNSGFNQLYNPIFCDLFKTNNGFEQCKNCTLNTKNVWKTSSQNTEQSCLDNCNNDIRCTSYRYNNTKKTNNCTSYIDFPTEINNNVKDINSGYSLKFGYNYEKLNTDQKNNVKNKCANQYLNNEFDKNERVNISECITFNDTFNLNTSKINVDPKCLYDIYSEKGKGKVINNDNYIQDNDENIKTDPAIDDYRKIYNQFNLLSAQNKNINNDLLETDIKYSDYNNNVNNENNNLKSILNNSISEQGKTMSDNTDEILRIIGDNKTNLINKIPAPLNLNNSEKEINSIAEKRINSNTEKEIPIKKNFNNIIIDLINNKDININNIEKFNNINKENINKYTYNNFIKYTVFIIFIILIVFIIFIIFKKK